MVPAKRVLLLVLLMLCFASLPSIPSSASDLTEALKLRDVNQVRSLLAAGANANEKVRGDYPLNIAATLGPAEMVIILLEARAGLEQRGQVWVHFSLATTTMRVTG
jgi:ankyrin repeat protein